MSKWAIIDGSAGRLCILPIGPILDARLLYGYVIHKEVECCGLLEAMKILHEYEVGSGSTGVIHIDTGMELDPGYFEAAKRRIEEAQQGR